MGLSDWVRETAANVRSESTSFAVKHAAHTLYLGAVRRLSPLFDEGDTFWDDSWDVLVILDACRPDLIREASTNTSYDWLPSPSEIQTVRSPGSTSHEWMETHFTEEYRDEMEKTAYVTANLFIQDYDFESFSEFCLVTESQESGLEVTPPRPLTDRAINIWRRREELDVDQMIVHYMQPHTPFRSRPDLFIDREMTTGWGRGFVRLRDGEIEFDEFWEAYLDNLLWVLEDLDLLTSNCDADIIATADHGNGLGELGIYGHPNGIPFSSVRDVPWIQIEGHDENTYSPTLPENFLDDSEDLDENVLSERLNALGYV